LSNLGSDALKRRKKVSRKSWKQGRKRYFLLALPLVAAGVIAFLLTSRPMTSPHGLLVDPATQTLLYEVPPNIRPSALAADLHAKGLIDFPRTFRLFLRVTRRDRQIKAGFYTVKSRNSVLEMAWLLTSGKLATRSFTIPEGKASWEIYGILKKRFDLDSVTFDSLVNSPGFARELGINAPGLEGYLFPDTYVVPWKVSEREILRVLVKRFQEVAESMHPVSPVTDRYGINGWVTLASIVEKEAGVPSERKLIAGVFYNRLLQNWSLGADPTVRFIHRRLTGPLTVKDLNVNSPYNTRRFTGLPPGPICNPGKGALLAALNPEDTEMMFFVAKDNGSRQHFFSKNNTEHIRFKSVAAENRRSRSAKTVLEPAGPDSPGLDSNKLAPPN
jgi:UPF0755 protein